MKNLNESKNLIATLNSIKNQVNDVDKTDAAAMSDLFYSHAELKYKLEDDFRLCPMVFNNIVGFSSEYKDKMLSHK